MDGDGHQGETWSLTFSSTPRKKDLPELAESAPLHTTLLPTTFLYTLSFKVLFTRYAAGVKTALS